MKKNYWRSYIGESTAPPFETNIDIFSSAALGSSVSQVYSRVLRLYRLWHATRWLFP